MSIKSRQPKVSIVIVNWNGLEDTKLCLEHTRQQTYANTEIIVVDNGSNDASLSYLRKQNDIVLVELPSNTGFTGGHIAGRAVAEGKYVLLLNNDAVMDKKYVEIGVDYLEEHDDVAVLGGRAYFWNDENPILATTNNYYAYQQINIITAEGIFTQKDEGVIRDVNNVSGSCVFVRNSTIEKIGYLHDPFFAYYEESDLFARVKRYGERVVYHPGLAIWHANGKSAEKKGSSFSYYMMMRNRFAFAVRNFDGWSLTRFIKFYVKMGIVSGLKSLIPSKKYLMDRAYAKAFAYNLIFGWKAFRERKRLRQIIGEGINYSQTILREQTVVSTIVPCDSEKQVDACKQLAGHIKPWDELILIINDESLVEYSKKFCDINTRPARLCINRGYFKTHSENLGIVSSRGEWVLLSSDPASRVSVTDYAQQIYAARKGRKNLIAFGEHHKTKIAPEDIASGMFMEDVLMNRNLLIATGGLNKAISRDAALRLLAGLAAYNKSLLVVESREPARLTPYSSESTLPFSETVTRLAHSMKKTHTTHSLKGQLNNFLSQHYHFNQLALLLRWLFSPQITLHLKLARIRNISLGVLKLQRVQIARELKHVRNEILHNQLTIVDQQNRKESEQTRLSYLKNNASESTVFIITRDRITPLKQLIAWLEARNIHRIVFVDNDSALPPLIDYLKSTPYQVIETGQNVGHTVLWTSSIIRTLLPDDFYIVTDPDVIPVLDSIDVIERLYEVHEKYPNHLKVGLGLNIDDLPDGYELKSHVIQWESQFWKVSLGPEVYEAGVDTTFALYKPYTYDYFLHPSIRTGEPYTARHLPWYNDSKKLTDEDIFYRLRADQTVNSWDANKLPDRYRKELAKQR